MSKQKPTLNQIKSAVWCLNGVRKQWAGPESELWQTSQAVFLTSRWSCFTSLSRLRGSSIIYCTAGHVNTIFKRVHYVPLKRTHALTDTFVSSLPPPHTHTHRRWIEVIKWSSLFCIKLQIATKRATPFAMKGGFNVKYSKMYWIVWNEHFLFLYSSWHKTRRKYAAAVKEKKRVLSQTGWEKRGKVLQQRFTVPLYEHWGCCSINPLSLCFY